MKEVSTDSYGGGGGGLSLGPDSGKRGGGELQKEEENSVSSYRRY